MTMMISWGSGKREVSLVDAELCEYSCVDRKKGKDE